MYCDKCGRKLDEEARYCSFCGSPVEEKKASDSNSSLSKPADGMGYGYKQIKPLSKDSFDEEWEREERKEKITFMIFGVVIVGLVIAIVCGLIALLKDESEKIMMNDSYFSSELNEDLQQNKDENQGNMNKPNASGSLDAAVTPELLQPEENDKGNTDADASNDENQNNDDLDDNDSDDDSNDDSNDNLNDENDSDSEEDVSEYIIYDSDVRYLTAADLNDLTAWEIRVARNELFARHGRMFDSKDLQEYFLSKSWYTPLTPAAEFNNSLLNDVEKENLNFILNYEKAHDLN